jgi:hypothetical protein
MGLFSKQTPKQHYAPRKKKNPQKERVLIINKFFNEAIQNSEGVRSDFKYF